MATTPKQTPLGPWPNGMHTASDLPEDKYGRKTALNKALNVDFSSSGTPRSREGYTKLLDLVNAHSLFSTASMTLFVENNFLKRIYADSLVVTNLADVAGEVCYADVQGVVYFSDGVSLRRVYEDNTVLPAWTPNPSGMVTINETASGSLRAGKYQLTITNISAAGEESGADIAFPFDVAGGGIILSGIPQSTEATHARVYMTTANGSEFYAQADIPMGTTTYTISAHRLGKALETQFAEPMIAGDILATYRGRMYSAAGNLLMYSEALRPGLTRLMDNFFPPFSGDITLVMSAENGIYVVADKTYFLAGSNPDEMDIREVYPHAGVKGTGIYVPSSVLGADSGAPAPVWFSDTGSVVGSPTGQVTPFMEDKVAVNEHGKGATLYKEERGIKSIVTALQDSGEVSKLGVSDSISFEVRRNGVIVPA